jgi:N-acetylmuramoyl-L-alanine amidase
VGGIEARKPLDFFNAGYVGSLTTVHANLAEKSTAAGSPTQSCATHAKTSNKHRSENPSILSHMSCSKLGRHILGEVLGLRGSGRNFSSRRECSWTSLNFFNRPSISVACRNMTLANLPHDALFHHNRQMMEYAEPQSE